MGRICHHVVIQSVEGDCLKDPAEYTVKFNHSETTEGLKGEYTYQDMLDALTKARDYDADLDGLYSSRWLIHRAGIRAKGVNKFKDNANHDAMYKIIKNGSMRLI